MSESRGFSKTSKKQAADDNEIQYLKDKIEEQEKRIADLAKKLVSVETELIRLQYSVLSNSHEARYKQDREGRH